MPEVKKPEVIRGMLVSDQYLSQRRLSELTIGQSYYIKKMWIKYIGKFGNKNRFQLISL